MNAPLDFEWDEDKAVANLAKHKIPFEAAIAVFADSDALHLDTTRKEDGEVREKIIGLIEGRLFTIVFTMRSDAVRIISARRSNNREEKSYGNRSL